MAFPAFAGEIHVATRAGNQAKISRILKKAPASINELDEEGRTPLHIAVAANRQPLVAFLLKRKPDLEIRDGESRTALDLAVIDGSVKVAELLLKAGADPNGRLERGETPLHLALDNPRMMALLLASQASVNIPDEAGATVFHHAVTLGDTKMLGRFFAHKPDLESRDGQLNTPLHRAVIAGRPEVITMLLDSGASVNVSNAIFRLSPIHLAVRSGSIPVIRLLLDKGARLDVGDAEGSTPLHLAVTAGETEIAELLLTRGANPGARDSSGNTPLHLSATAGLKAMTTLLISRRAPINATDTAGCTPLHVAIIKDRDASERADEWEIQIRDRSQVVRVLLDARADVNARDHLGMTPLHWAALQGDRSLAELLVSYGADLNAETRDDDELTPLSIAIKFGHSDVAAYIREHGGDD